MSDPITVSIDAWKRKLLDLTRRNKALHFRITKASTIEIVDERPAEVFKHLYIEQRPMAFRASDDDVALALDDQHSPASDSVDSILQIEESASELKESDSPTAIEPYDKAALHSRHTDDVLQTAHTATVLDRNLRRLSELARLSIEEQGLNTLFLSLGMLHYYESPDSSELSHAPLLLLPVTLVRKNARSGFTVRWSEDEPLMNPTLSEYLKRSFGLQVPALKDQKDSDDPDIHAFFGEFTSLIKRRPRWELCDEIYLAQFSFQKLVLYNDLERHADAIASHRLVQSLVTKRSSYNGELPDQIRNISLDDHFPPETTHQVVDADSSQQRALAAIAHKQDLVLIGPPGTGKSQTITNIIANALATGRTVLFVAEKMAALEVVHRRLAAAGLGEFCLELHSTKSNKRHVMTEIGRALDASLSRPGVQKSSAERLPHFRNTLNHYALALHQPYGTLNISPYQALGELAKVEAAPKVRLGQPISDIDQSQFSEIVEQLRELAIAQEGVGDPKRNAWRGSRKTYYSATDLEDIKAIISECISGIELIQGDSSTASRELGLPPVVSLDDMPVLVEIASILARSPSAAEEILRSDVWNAPPVEAELLIKSVEKLKSAEQAVYAVFESQIINVCQEDEVDYYRKKRQTRFGLLAFFDSRFRQIHSRWRSCLRESVKCNSLELLAHSERALDLKSQLESLDKQRPEGLKLFGEHWRGSQSTVEELKCFAEWVVNFRKAFIAHHLGDGAVKSASRATPDTTLVSKLSDECGRLIQRLTALSELLEAPLDNYQKLAIDDLLGRLQAMNADLHAAVRWAAFELARQRVESSSGAELLPHADAGRLQWRDLPNAFARAFYQKWLDIVVAEREPLRGFTSLTHEERIREFRQLDQRVMEENRLAIVAALREATQKRLRDPQLIPALSYLRRELSRQRGHRPLRETMRFAAQAIRVIKPCLLMSPSSVAQFLEGEEPGFDLLVFDEASQLPTEEAIGALIRAKQVVVVGDPNQLPPTNFFSIMGGQIEPILGDDGQPIFDDSESILEEVQAAGIPKCFLTWHYRSLFESLIEFSNRCFYDSRLMTFPSPAYDAQSRGIEFQYIPDGRYEGSGRNRQEARRLVDAIVRHAKSSPHLSLGVGTFSLRQQIEIGDELEQRRRQQPELEPFLANSHGEPFFIKNLETIQGDERDVIFLSITYGKTDDGKLRYNFGPLNSQNGWRRLNVLVSRARRKMVVFTSIRGDDISPATDSAGALLLRDFLIFAEKGRFDGTRVVGIAAAESPFERSVHDELTRRGLTLDAQVGVAGYRIDLGVRDPDTPGRYICGIECDGAAYHSSETARDRDRLRHQVLTDRGWTLYRIWSTDWFKDREGQIQRILGLVGGIRSRNLASIGSLTAPIELNKETPLSETGDHSSYQPEIEPGRLTVQADYRRPSVPAYVMATISEAPSSDIQEAEEEEIYETVLKVVEAEAPLHVDDLLTRVAGRWGNRAGSRISRRILDASKLAERRGQLRMKSNFVYKLNTTLNVRSRLGTGIPAERIAPEEFQEAVLLILGRCGSMGHEDLVVEVRTLLGFQRTGHHLETRIQDAISDLVHSGRIGESSMGYSLTK